MPRLARLGQIDNSRLDCGPLHGDIRGADRQLEPSWPAASRIDIQDTLALLHLRLVRMTGDDDPDPGGAGVDIELIEIVNGVEEDAANADQFRRPETRRP